MKRRRGRMLVAVVIASGVWSGVASTALGYYTVTPMCTAGEHTSTCGSGWYTSNLFVSWAWSPNDGGNPTSGCLPQSYARDTSTTVSCTVQGPSGGGSATQAIHVEISTPTAFATPLRPPDHDGWYNHPVAFAFQGAAFSGIAWCTTATYSGPSSPDATVIGSCIDNAGKTAGTSSPPFPYDATPPAVAIVAKPADGVVVLRWRAIGDLDQIASLEIVRAPGRRGRASSVLYRGNSTGYRDPHVGDGVRYRYTLIARDQAGNVSERIVAVTAGPRLLSPGRGAPMSTPPLLRWTPVHRATYYNVQIYRGSTKILSAWPSRARLQLERSWRFDGRRYLLGRGTYRWYVWPGFGPRAAARYGPRIGTSTFVVLQPA